jgi:hypothetical protein
MKRILLVLGAVLIGAVVVGVIGSAAHAQSLTPGPIDPMEYCRSVEKVDLNGDGRLDHNDFELWVLTLHERTGDECRLGGPASGCPEFMDVNGDGIVDHEDLKPLEQYLLFCGPVPWRATDLGG